MPWSPWASLPSCTPCASTSTCISSPPAGLALFGMMSVFAEFERAMIQERIRAGVARARAQGKRLGRPRIDDRMEHRIRAALAKGDRGILRIAADLGVGSGTVQRTKTTLVGTA